MFHDDQFEPWEPIDPDTEIGVSDGKGGVLSFCCSENRHDECMGMLEFRMGNIRVSCNCPCHDKKKE